MFSCSWEALLRKVELVNLGMEYVNFKAFSVKILMGLSVIWNLVVLG